MEPVARRLSLILLAIALVVAGSDLVWALQRHFDIDGGAYAGIAVLAAALAAAAAWYGVWRREPALSAMLAGTAFLCAFSAGFSVLNYFLLTVAGTRIDLALDRAMGISWPALMAFAAAHPAIDRALFLAYVTMLPQVALCVIVLGCTGRALRIYAFCFAMAAGAAMTVAFWTLHPSFGAFSVYALPASLRAHLQVALDARYAQALVGLLAHGPGRIAPEAVRGLVGFPSYHAVLALLVIWALRDVRYLRWFVIALNLLVLIATPIQGGHHVVDVIAGFGVAAAAIALANAIVSRAKRYPHGERAASAEPAHAALAPSGR